MSVQDVQATLTAFDEQIKVLDEGCGSEDAGMPATVTCPPIDSEPRVFADLVIGNTILQCRNTHGS